MPTKTTSPMHEEEEHDKGGEDKTEEIPKKKNMNEDVSKVQQDVVGQGNVQSDSTIPTWLDKELKSKKIMVYDTPPNWDELLANIGKGKVKKKARVISRIERCEANNRVIHIATPMPDKNKDEVTSKDYSVQTISLGPTSMMQEVEEFEGSSAAILSRLKKEVQAK